MFQTTNQIVIDVGKTINNPPVITIFFYRSTIFLSTLIINHGIRKPWYKNMIIIEDYHNNDHVDF